MRKAMVYRNGILAGSLTESEGYIFKYEDLYFSDPRKLAVSLTLPKSRQEYTSNKLFPFFYNMLAEGINKKLQCRQLKIDENDHFGLLLATGHRDTIGAVTVKEVDKL